jgi:Tol biopolymer transport system component
MSPEQASGKAVDKRADIWSFGVVLFEMLTGQRLFTGESVAETLASVLKGDPPWEALPSDCPPALTRLLRRCLQRRSRERLQDIGDARLELEDALSGDERELGGRRVVAPPTWRRALPWGLAAGLAVACVALAFRSAPEPDLIRLDLAPPRGARLWGLGGRIRPAVSPDGRMLAFSAWDAEGRSKLYIRPFDAAEARTLTGTDGGTFPFWSPDSRFIGFFADGQLKKVEAGGGAPMSLCDAPSGRGGSWSPQGIIVFSPDFTAPLHRVAAEGGEPSPVTELDSSGKDDSHRFPHFLPGGRRFLYLARASGEVGEGHAVRVGSLDGDQGKLLLHSSAAATYASGHLLYVRDGTLHARPLELKRLELTGEETPLVQGVRLDSAPGFAAFSASPTGVLAYLSGERQTRSTLEWHDRAGTNIGTLGDPADYLGVHLSPDGTRAGTDIADSHQVPDLWIYDISRDLRTRFTFDPRWDLAATWSPDGRDLVFSSARKGHLDLYRKTVEGSGEPELLFASEREKLAMDISPDGKLLAFQQLGPDANEDLWVLPLLGDGEPRPFLATKFDETSGVFSPDGRWMAYVSNESERREVYVAAFPGGEQKRQVSTEGGVKPRWRRDGRELFYQGLDGRLMAVEVEVLAERLVIGEPERLFLMTPEVSPAPTYSPMPDGQRFLVVTPVESEVSTPLSVVLNWPRLLKESR